MNEAMRGSLSMLAYSALFLLTGFALLRLGLVQDTTAELFAALPLILCVAGTALAWRFNRSRAVFAFLTLGLAFLSHYWAPWNQPEPVPTAEATLAALALILPLNLALAVAIGDRGVLTPRGFTQLLLIVYELTAVLVIVSGGLWLLPPGEAEGFRQGVANLLSLGFLPQRVTAWTGLPQLGLFAAHVALLYLLYKALRESTPVNAGFGGALLAALMGLGARTPEAASVYFTVAMLILLTAILVDSYRMAFLDELTGLPTRRVLKADFKKIGSEYSVAMVDVDHFKKFNDTYGHDVGDQVLRMVATRLAKVTGGGKSYRYGGEEFTVLFPKLDKKAVKPHLEALRSAIEKSEFAVRGKDRPKQKPESPGKVGTVKTVTVTVSIGAAERSNSNTTPDEVTKAADKALYKAKKNGRNRVELG